MYYLTLYLVTIDILNLYLPLVTLLIPLLVTPGNRLNIPLLVTIPVTYVLFPIFTVTLHI